MFFPRITGSGKRLHLLFLQDLPYQELHPQVYRCRWGMVVVIPFLLRLTCLVANLGLRTLLPLLPPRPISLPVSLSYFWESPGGVSCEKEKRNLLDGQARVLPGQLWKLPAPHTPSFCGTLRRAATPVPSCTSKVQQTDKHCQVLALSDHTKLFSLKCLMLTYEKLRKYV